MFPVPRRRITRGRKLQEAIELGGAFLVGCIWATTLCLLIWRIHPHGPARRAVVAAYARLSDMLADLLLPDSIKSADKRVTVLSADHRRAVRNAIEHAHALLARLPRQGDVERDYIGAGLDIADQMFATLIAIDHHIRKGMLPPSREMHLDTIAVLGEVLAELQLQAACRMPDGRALIALAARLSTDRAGNDRFLSKVNAQCAAALRSVVRQWPPVALQAALDKPGEVQHQAAKRAFLTMQIVRHAARVAIAVVVAYAAAKRREDSRIWLETFRNSDPKIGELAVWRQNGTRENPLFRAFSRVT